MNKLIAIVIVVLCLVGSALPGDKPDTTGVAPYIHVQTATLANGKGSTYTNLIRQYKEATAASNVDTYWLAASGLTGDSRNVTFVTSYRNLAEMQQAIQDSEKVFQSVVVKNANFESQIGEIEQVVQSSLWKFSPSLSYLPEKVPEAAATHWMVYTFHVKPGMNTAFNDVISNRIQLVKQGHIDEWWIMYESFAGNPTSTMIAVVPLRSLADLDNDEMEAWKAVMTPIVRQHMQDGIRTSIAKIDSQLYMVRPDLSRPTPSMVAANPDFWTVKEPATPVAAKKSKKAKAGESAQGQ